MPVTILTPAAIRNCRRMADRMQPGMLGVVALACCLRHFQVDERDGGIAAIRPVPEAAAPRWARGVSQQPCDWPAPAAGAPVFLPPIPFVVPPVDAGEPFHPHNHQPSVAWLSNGDLLAVWYSTREETGTELTVLAARLRRGAAAWDPAAEFFKAAGHNMHGSAVFHDGAGTIHHLNGIAPAGARGWQRLALLHRTSRDHGATWSAPRAVGPLYQQRHQVVSGTLLTRGGTLVQPCDAVPGGHGGTALHLSRDGGETWADPGQGRSAPRFAAGATGAGTIAGIHAGVAELADGRLLAFGRGDPIAGRMPQSVSADAGTTWAYSASPFPPIGGGQRLVLRRLREGPLLFVSFTGPRGNPLARGLEFTRADGTVVRGRGLFAALSDDDGTTWPLRKLLTPGAGTFDGGAWTGTFTATPCQAEPAGYLAATQTPDGTIHLLSSRLHYRFNLAWLRQPAAAPRPSAEEQPPGAPAQAAPAG